MEGAEENREKTMEGAEENREKFNLSLGMNGSSRDLLRGVFRNQTHHSNGHVQSNGGENGEEGEQLQLSLGLSMNGQFGVDPANKKLRRSCSISNFAFSAADSGSSHQARGVAFESYAPLARTCSLPVESEEDFRRRKEEQSARRLEARKKRMEKKNARVARDKENSSEDASNNENGGDHDAFVELESVNGLENGNVANPSSQGSIGSQRSGSSGFSDLQSQQSEGAGQNGEARSPTSLRSVQLPPVRAAAGAGKRTHEEVVKTSTVLDMPYVSTIEDGTMNKIEGFLYKYKKCEEVKIVCVCHGLFLNPGEFVEHAGGGEVDNPLKHIVVNTSPLF